MIPFAELPIGDSMHAMLDDLQIDFAFQPIFDRNQNLLGYEALMRPKGMTVTEMRNRFNKEGRLHVMELATFIGATHAYYERGFRDVAFSVNSMPTECFTPEESAIYFNCFPNVAPYLIVEILNYTDIDTASWKLKQKQILDNEGIMIALDGFGTGRAMLTSVSMMHPRLVKIDPAYIHAIHRNMKSQDTLQFYVEKLHAMGIKVLAKGIETEEEYRYLLDETDIDQFQGNYLGRPQ